MRIMDIPSDTFGNEQQVAIRPAEPSAMGNIPDVVESGSRPQKYTFHEVYQMITALTWPRILFGLLVRHEWNYIFLSLGFLILDAIEALQNFNPLQHLAIVGMTILSNILIYKSIRPYVRVQLYEWLIRADVNVHITQETVVRVVNCVNRCLVTLQFIIFQTEIIDLLLMMLALEVVRKIVWYTNILLLIRIVLCVTVVCPRLFGFFDNNATGRAYYRFKIKKCVLQIVDNLAEMGVEVNLLIIERWKQEAYAMRELYYDFEDWPNRE
ncbi:uncharacterized protein LOC6726583 [Drosophila simulans]|nr:uncharacterized protein LOC6726583 [Drosophila simulans]KMZ10891.1 uncharacterized protein Dsimw501_GD17522 [Drosophila simulans]